MEGARKRKRGTLAHDQRLYVLRQHRMDDFLRGGGLHDQNMGANPEEDPGAPRGDGVNGAGARTGYRQEDRNLNGNGGNGPILSGPDPTRPKFIPKPPAPSLPGYDGPRPEDRTPLPRHPGIVAL